MDTTLTFISPAKLNLFLHINGRRSLEDKFPGYHELQSVFQLLDRGDVMHFTLEDKPGIRITPELDGIPIEDNLIYKAAKSLIESSTNPHSRYGVHIHIDKNLPMGGGLGGGSSNAATTLLALNFLWKINLTTSELADIGAKLGADVPIFIIGQSAWAEGIGDIITPITLKESWYLILCPACHVNTREIFSHERLTRDTPKKRIAPALEGQVNKRNTIGKSAALNKKDSDFLSDEYRNDCEALVCDLHPEIQSALNWLKQFATSRLTGTGACCFARFESEEEAQQVLNEARSKFKGFIAKGVNLSPALQRLNEA